MTEETPLLCIKGKYIYPQDTAKINQIFAGSMVVVVLTVALPLIVILSAAMRF